MNLYRISFCIEAADDDEAYAGFRRLVRNLPAAELRERALAEEIIGDPTWIAEMPLAEVRRRLEGVA